MYNQTFDRAVGIFIREVVHPLQMRRPQLRAPPVAKPVAPTGPPAGWHGAAPAAQAAPAAPAAAAPKPAAQLVTAKAAATAAAGEPDQALRAQMEVLAQ